ncbi:Protein of unknown function [Atopomonas hussainii]|uniref:DUF4197 domain-containing protein n=1 Tax=Atopomonas hussainii TaxID=1429083 RepID=A0A1H7PJ44_9GAMM|nr:DUF4197 domain-containing protein [Atopomonas hussainii]SEL35498.1 Protein of unknown function [Atopomonas hussainii]
MRFARPALTLFAGLSLSLSAMALSLSDLSQGDATGALRSALTQGAEMAVDSLGRTDGLLGNPEVRIELPGDLGKAAKMMKTFGMGSEVTALETAMNRAAEAAVPEARKLLVDAVKNMSVSDAKGILTGGDTAGTEYLNRSSREQLQARFLPIVKQMTDKVGLAQQYNAFAGQAASFGVIDAKSANLESYVTEQALDGLFTLIGQEEQKIRQNPAEAAGSLAKKVFGLL